MKGKVPLFFALTLFAWVIWIPQAAERLGLFTHAPSLQSPLNALTVWSPGLAAIFLTLRAAGSPGMRTLFRPLLSWRVPAKWYAVALFLESGKWLAAFGVDRLLGRSYELGSGVLLSYFSSAAAYMMPVAIIFTLPNALGEELGWRGYALPRLQARHGALVASVIIGLFWGFWHLPAWIAWDVVQLSWFPVLLKIVNTVPVVIVFTWLFNNTRGSLLLVCLFHASIATRWYLLPSLPTSTENILSWLVAILIVVLTRPSTFCRGESPRFRGHLMSGR